MEEITKTGPLTGSELQSINNGPFLSKKDRKAWFKTYKHKDRYTGDIEDGEFTNPDLERRFRNSKFKEKFRGLENYKEWAGGLSPEERDSIYQLYPTLEDYQLAQSQFNPETQAEPDTSSSAPQFSLPDRSSILNPFGSETLLNVMEDSYNIPRWANFMRPDLVKARADIARKEEEAVLEKERLERRKGFIEDWYAANPSVGGGVSEATFSQTGRWLRDEFDDIFGGRQKAAEEYADEMERQYNLTPEQKAAEQRWKDNQKLYAEVYGDTPFWRVNADGKLRLGLGTAMDKGAEFADEMERKYIREHTVVPVEENAYSQGISRQDFRNVAMNESSVYGEFRGSDWLPEGQIPWDELYNQTHKLFEDGHHDQARYIIDKVLDEIIGENQDLVGHDNQGHMGKLNAAGVQFYTMGTESLMEGITFIPSAVVGLAQATFNPNDFQTKSGFNWWNRFLDNTIHNDWLGFASNQSVSDWAAEASENAVIYGDDFGDYLMKGSGTAGAFAGNTIMFLTGSGELKLATKLASNAAKATERVLAKEIVSEGAKSKAALFAKKATEQVNLFKANYAEAVQQGLEGERGMYEIGQQMKFEAVDGLKPKMPLQPQEYTYTQEELEEAFGTLPLAWQEYFKAINAGQPAIPPEQGVDAGEMLQQVQMTAQGLHEFYQQVPDYNDAVAAHARRKANVDVATQTALLFTTDKLLGGIDKGALDFVMGRRALSRHTLSDKIKGEIGNLTLKRNVGSTAWKYLREPVSETFTEVGQQSISAVTKQVAEHNINDFLMDQLYGPGLLTVASVSYEHLANLDKEEFARDAALKETVLQTLITTPLMPTLGWSGKQRPKGRRANQSKLSYMAQQAHYYSPIGTQVTNQIFNDIANNSAAQDYVDYINRWGADPQNASNTRGVIGITNYTAKMLQDLINNDEVAYNNDMFSRDLSEAIMLSNAPEAEFAKNRIRLLQNMASIKSGTQEEQQAAIESFRKEMAGNTAVQSFSDEQVLDLLEGNGKRVLDLYEKVSQESQKLDDIFGAETLNWQEKSARLFGKFAQENLNERIEQKQQTIASAVKQMGESLDLGKTTSDFEKVNSGRVPYKSWHLSGQDLLRLNPLTRAYAFNPKYRNSFNAEQQKIIEDTLNALNTVDESLEAMIYEAGEEVSTVKAIKQSYDETLKTPMWTSKKVEKEGKRIVDSFSPDKRAKKFQEKASKAQSVQDLKQIYDQEVAANDERKASKQFDVDKALNNIQDPEVKKKVAELNKMQQASNSIGAAISSSSLPLELKENLLGQVEGLMNSQNSASALYDIANYSLSGVRPDEKDKMAGELSQILSSAKSTADNAQTVYTNPVDSKKDSQFGQATDLSSRDVDTAPAVNKEPIKKFTPEEATKLVNEINALLAKNEFMTATPMINELQKRCPEGYQFMQGGTQVALKKIDTSTPISEVTVDESLEEEPEFVPEGEVVVDEELDSSLDAYPDEDVRSITKIAIVTFEPGGREYAYPVRDEDVQMGDTVDGKSNQGKIERFETPDEYAVKHPDGDYTLEKLAKFKRGTFIDRHTDKAETAEPVPVKRVVTTHRSETQQSRLNANVTPARSEVSPQHIKDGSMTRLGDTNHTDIDAQLDENGAFRYVDEGMLNQDDELVFVVTEEEMPDGQKTPVIWEVTKSKIEDLPTDGKFLGYQVINVLDQTSMSGDRGELIARIREAYEKAGKPASFLYDSEPVKVKNIVKGFIPTRQTNPVDAQSQETIASTNLKQGLVKSNGRWGVMFKSSKTGKLMHVPVVLRQIKRDIDGNIKPSISHTGIDTIETIKHNPLTQDETREVMLVVPTPTGWQAAHSVYVLKRDIQDAVENYKEAINNGVLGERLIAKAMLRFTDPKATTAFSDFLRFNRGVSERIVFDPTHNRLELGIRGNLDTTFVYASKRGETWVITEADARNILDDNEGKGFTTEEVLKRYLNALADSEDAGISVQINMDAISKDNSIIDALIDDGFLWAPNSYPGRLTMENVGFEAPLSETAEAEPKVEDDITTEPEPAITAPKPSNPVIEEPVTTTQKIKVPNSVDSNDVGAMVPRKKKSSSSEKKISITPTTPRTEQASTQEAPLMDELKVEAKKSYNELSAESKAHLEEKGISQEEWDKHPEIHENVLNC